VGTRERAEDVKVIRDASDKKRGSVVLLEHSPGARACLCDIRRQRGKAVGLLLNNYVNQDFCEGLGHGSLSFQISIDEQCSAILAVNLNWLVGIDPLQGSGTLAA